MLDRGKIHRNVSVEAETNEVVVEKLVYGGDGLARDGGRVVLTPFVLPGERATVALVQKRKDLVRAKLLSVQEPSSERVKPGCPYFGRCGGCDYQHASYPYQLAQKETILREVLQRIGHITAPEQIDVIAGEPWGYRNRSQFHIDRGQLGYLEEGSHKLCAIDHCPISSPKINEGIAVLLGMMKDRRFPRFVRSIELFTNETDVQVNVLETDQPVGRHFFDWFREKLPAAVAGALDYPAQGATYRVSGRSFFQVNRYLIDRLVDNAVDNVTGKYAIDLYAGVGLFSLRLARQFGRVTAVEGSVSAEQDLEFNAHRAGVIIEAIRQQVESFLMQQEETPDFVLADPPRAGLGKVVVNELVRLKPERLTIVACDPSTLARDLIGLLGGGFQIERIALVDLFPHTYHMETVVELRRQ